MNTATHLRAVLAPLIALALLLTPLSAPRPAAAQIAGPAAPLKDLNQATLGVGNVKGAALGGRYIFVATRPTKGTQLWATDGSLSGTQLLSESAGNIAPVALGGHVYFVGADAQHGRELWRSDGTPAGTTRFADLAPGAASFSPAGLAAHAGALYFLRGGESSELWRSDGTPAGTARVAALGAAADDAARIYAAEGRIFVRPTLVGGLWASNGTPAGTTALITPDQPGAPAQLFEAVSIGPRLLFTAGQTTHSCEAHFAEQLWVSDGTPAGTAMLRDFYTPPAPAAGERIGGCGSSTSFWEARGLTVAGGALFFAVRGALWRSDGTPAGTAATGVGGVKMLAGAGGKLLLFGETAVRASDGTPAGTTPLAEGLALRPTPAPTDGLPAQAYPIGAAGGSTFFAAEEGGRGAELWASDGTPAGTRLVADIKPGPGSSNPMPLADLAGRLVFSADDGVGGREIWVSDGTPAGTRATRDIEPLGAGSDPRLLTRAGGRAFLFTNVADAPAELWLSDGTPAGTTRVAALPFGRRPAKAWAAGERVVFTLERITAQGLTETEIWLSDGTAAGTLRAPNMPPYLLANAPVSLGERVIFQVGIAGDQGYEIWSTDGTPGGTARVQSVRLLSNIAVAGGAAYYITLSGEGCDLWRSDGTAAGTRSVRRYTGTSGGGPLCDMPSRLIGAGASLFMADDSALWASDGTAAGTRRVAGPEVRVGEAYPSGDKLFFLSSDAAGAPALWVSDGTSAGTRALLSDAPSYLYAGAGGRLFYTNLRGEPGQRAIGELYVTDGSTAGTRLLQSVPASASGATISGLAAAGDGLYYLIPTDGGSTKLWRSDGTPGGTYQIQELPAPSTVDTDEIVSLGEHTLVAGYELQLGRELWLIGPARQLSAPPLSFAPAGGELSLPVRLRGRGLLELRLSLADGLSFAGSGPEVRSRSEGGRLVLSMEAPADMVREHTIPIRIKLPAGAAPGSRWTVTIEQPAGEGQPAQRLSVEVGVGALLYLPSVAR